MADVPHDILDKVVARSTKEMTDEERCEATGFMMRFFSPEFKAILQKMVGSGSVSVRDIDAFKTSVSMPLATRRVISFLDMENRDQLLLYVGALQKVVQKVVKKLKIQHTTDRPDDASLYVYALTVNNVRFLMVGGFDLMHKQVFRTVAGLVVASANMIMNDEYKVPAKLESKQLTYILVQAMITFKDSFRSSFVDMGFTANSGSLRTTASVHGQQLQTYENGECLYVNLGRILTIGPKDEVWNGVPNPNGVWNDAVLDKVKYHFLNPPADPIINPPDFNTSPSKKRCANGSPGGSASRRKAAA